MQIQVPRKLKPLLGDSRYKGAYGGRGGAKSHFFGTQGVLKTYAKPIRMVCIREVQNSIKDSVKQLLTDKIASLGLGASFDILDQEIRCKRTGSLIIFKGMQSYNAENIKSLEDYDIAWVEEAQTLSAYSLQMLRPTLRSDDSEMWFSWNPRHRTDPVDQFFRKNPPEECISVMVNWRDNPWFPAVLRKEMLHDYRIDPERAEHIWEGAYGVDEGAILARHVDHAEREGRINPDVAYDPAGAPLEISSDIGFRDTASWWFWQRLHNGYRVFDYDEDSGLDAEEWIERLKLRIAENGYRLGRIHLPHDARAQTFQSKHPVIETFLKAFGPKVMRIVARTSKTDRINAGRLVLKTTEINSERCTRGLDGLRAWIYKWDPDKQVFSKEPEHNWASHPGDGFTYGCQQMQFEAVPDDDKAPIKWPLEQTAKDIFWPDDLGETRGNYI